MLLEKMVIIYIKKRDLDSHLKCITVPNVTFKIIRRKRHMTLQLAITSYRGHKKYKILKEKIDKLAFIRSTNVCL